MNGITRKIILKISLFISLFIFVPSLSWGYNYSAVDIYRQAHFKNYRFLEWLSQYRGAVDMQNRLGDTAFCIALKYNDMETMKILASYRANTSHPCVRRARNEYYASRELYQPVQQTTQYPTQTYPTPVRETNAPYISVANGNSNYLWWGLGGLLVGGGIGAAIGHSSGSHKTTYVTTDNNNGNGNNGGNSGGNDNGGNTGDDNGGNTGGDDNGGNTGGDDNGGNTGGDDNGGNTGGDDNGGNTGGDDNGGNTGGDDNGGNTGGDDNGGNTGGDDNGGNTGGDDNGGNTGGDDNGGNTGGDDNGGNTGGDDNGGNTGGDDNGGNTGGDDNGGNTGGDDNGGNTGGDDNGGNTGGDDNGGNTGGDDNGGNTGGDDNGGNTGGDDNGGNTGGDDNGGNTGGDDNGGNTGGDDNGGNTGGDDNGGNTGGDDNGGNTGGDDNGGNTGGDDNGGNTGGDDNGGNTGGDDNGGNTGGDDNAGSNSGGSDDGNSGNSGLTDVSASSFRTSEYTKGNFLDAIHAAEAYSIIYKQDANGNLVSHQAASDDPLKKVKVGVIDSGVFNNHADLSDKIVGNYDANQYNTKGNVWGYTRNHLHYYILYENGKYYFFSANTNNTPISVSPYSDMDLTTLNATLSDYGLTFSQFTLMNGAGGGNPGTSDEDFQSGTRNVGTWWEIVLGLSHGTHVAGIIAADKNDSGMHGVAFDNAQIYAGSWDMEQSIYNMTKTMVDNGVSVINNSWGYNTAIADASNPNWLKTHDTDFLSSYAYAASNDAVWVQSTGNEGSTEAGVQNAVGLLNLSSYGYNGAGSYEVPYVAVAALDTSTATSTAPLGRIADYSNWCGSAKDYCITAPGTDANSTIAINNGYMNMDGTSMSAPVVSGSIALLMGYYPYLSGQNIAWLLLETANHSGAYADSSIYGRGVLDLEAALTTPAGSLSTATGNNFISLKPVNDSKLYLNGSTQAKLAKALPEKIIAFDELHRPFEYKTENFVQATHASNANFRNKVSHAALGGAKKTIKDEKTGFSFSQSEALDKGGKQNLSSIEIVHETDDGSATRFYYTENSKYMVTDVLTPTDNPYFAMNEAYGAENTWKLNDSSKFKLSLQTGENGLYERDYEQDRASFTERSYAINAEYSFNLTDYLELSTIGGILFEEDAMLGMNGQGGFAIKDGSTYYMGLKAALNLTPNLSLLAAYYRGYTKGQDTSMLALSDIETESYMLAGEYTLSPLHKVGLSLSSPLSVVRGKASFRYASGRDNYSDTIYMQKLTTSLKPAAKEYDLGLYYKGTPQSNLNFLGRVETRFNADGEKGLTDYLGIVGMQYTFPK